MKYRGLIETIQKVAGKQNLETSPNEIQTYINEFVEDIGITIVEQKGSLSISRRLFRQLD